MRTGIYLPLINLKIDGVAGENILLHHLIRAGPVHRIIVHESEAWEKLSTKYLYEDMITLIPEKEHIKYTEISEEFFYPLIEGIKYFKWSKTGKPIPAVNLIYPLSRALFLLTLGNKYKTRIYEYDFLKDAIERILTIEKSNHNQFTDEGIERVSKFKNLLNAYNSFDEFGFLTNEDYKIHKEFRKLIFQKEIEKLSEEKHKLGILSAKLNRILFDIKEITTKIVNSNEFPWLTLTSYQLYLSTLQESIEKKVAQVIIPTIAYFLNKIRGFDLREYAPPIEKPRYYFGKTIQFNPVNSKISIIENNKKLLTFTGSIAGTKITILPRKKGPAP